MQKLIVICTLICFVSCPVFAQEKSEDDSVSITGPVAGISLGVGLVATYLSSVGKILNVEWKTAAGQWVPFRKFKTLRYGLAAAASGAVLLLVNVCQGNELVQQNELVVFTEDFVTVNPEVCDEVSALGSGVDTEESDGDSDGDYDASSTDSDYQY